MKRGKVLVIAALVASLLGVAGFAAVRAFDRPRPSAYVTEPVRYADIESAVVTWGTLQPFESVEVGTLVPGQLMSVDVKVGQWVKKDDIVAKVDSQRLNNEVRDAEQRLTNQRQNLGQAESQVAFSTAQLTRQERLRDGGFGARERYDQALNQVRNAQANLENTLGQIKTSEIRLQTQKDYLERATIRAPLDGMVVEIVSRPGQQLNPGQSSPVIMKVAKLDVMTVRVSVSEADIAKIRPGQKTWFTVLGFPQNRYYATLRMRELTPAGNPLLPGGAAALNAPRGVYYNALFEVPNPKGDLLPAMTAEVRVVLGEARHVLTVPVTALGPPGPDHLRPVKVLQPDGSLAERKVQIGLADASRVEVKSGLKEGDKVVIGAAAGA